MGIRLYSLYVSNVDRSDIHVQYCHSENILEDKYGRIAVEEMWVVYHSFPVLCL